MTPEQQVEFIQQLAHTVVEEMVIAIDAGKVPEDWDGHQLRYWMAKRFGQVFFSDRSRSWKRDVDNTIIVNNL